MDIRLLKMIILETPHVSSQCLAELHLLLVKSILLIQAEFCSNPLQILSFICIVDTQVYYVHALNLSAVYSFNSVLKQHLHHVQNQFRDAAGKVKPSTGARLLLFLCAGQMPMCICQEGHYLQNTGLFLQLLHIFFSNASQCL